MSVMSQVTLLSLRNKIIATTCYLSLLACETFVRLQFLHRSALSLGSGRRTKQTLATNAFDFFFPRETC